MYTAAERESVRQRLLELARQDPAVTGAAIIGSAAGGEEDQWSDVDLVFAVTSVTSGTAGLDEALQRWKDLVYQEFQAIHDWDLPAGPSVYRVFLLESGLEVDIGFTPAELFGAKGPRWQTVFGETVRHPEPPAAGVPAMIGFGWHHVLRGRACIDRGKAWQAERWISGVRDQVIAMACAREGYVTNDAKGAHELPGDITKPLEAALVRDLSTAELRRAHEAATEAFLAETERHDPHLANRLRHAIT